MVKKVADPRLRVFCVWTPAFPSDGQKLALEGAGILSDKRCLNFWDQGGKYGVEFGPVVRLPANKIFAFDVYFVYRPGARWEEKPPAPSDWMHQIIDDPRFLDGPKLASILQRELDALPK